MSGEFLFFVLFFFGKRKQSKHDQRMFVGVCLAFLDGLLDVLREVDDGFERVNDFVVSVSLDVSLARIMSLGRWGYKVVVLCPLLLMISPLSG